MYVQQSFDEIRDSSKCRLYSDIKLTFEMEPYCNRELRQRLSKVRFSSHNSNGQNHKYNVHNVDNWM